MGGGLTRGRGVIWEEGLNRGFRVIHNFFFFFNCWYRWQPEKDTSGFVAKWCLRNECTNSTLMMRHYPDLGNAFVWLKQISLAERPIRSTTEIWIVMCHQYIISCACFLYINSWSNQWWHRRMLAVFSGWMWHGQLIRALDLQCGDHTFKSCPDC